MNMVNGYIHMQSDNVIYIYNIIYIYIYMIHNIYAVSEVHIYIYI